MDLGWGTGLHECYKEPISCIVGLFCPCLLLGCIHKDAHSGSCIENWWACCCMCGFPVYRELTRKKLGVSGNVVVDQLATCLCPSCALCQMYRKVVGKTNPIPKFSPTYMK